MRIWLSITFSVMFLTIFVDWKTAEEEFHPISGAIFPTGETQTRNENQHVQIQSEVNHTASIEKNATSERPAERPTVAQTSRKKPVEHRSPSDNLPSALLRTGKTGPVVQLTQGSRESALKTTGLISNPPEQTTSQTEDRKKQTLSTPAPLIPKEEPKPPLKSETSPSSAQEDFVSFHTLRNAVKNSNSSYYFSGRSLTQKNVTVEALSLTPFRDKDILRFKIQNDQQEYFFVANISLYEQQKMINTEFFFEPLVAPGKSMDCIALIPRLSRSQLSLTIIESSGKNRTFTLKFVTL